VLAYELSREAILEAIAEGYSVACMLADLAQPAEQTRPHLLALGPFELVDLALFLDRYYFPQHNELCRQQAELARRVLNGDELPAGSMASVEADLEALYRECWGVKTEAEVEAEPGSGPGWQ